MNIVIWSAVVEALFIFVMTDIREAKMLKDLKEGKWR